MGLVPDSTGELIALPRLPSWFQGDRKGKRESKKGKREARKRKGAQEGEESGNGSGNSALAVGDRRPWICQNSL